MKSSILLLVLGVALCHAAVAPVAVPYDSAESPEDRLTDRNSRKSVESPEDRLTDRVNSRKSVESPEDRLTDRIDSRESPEDRLTDRINSRESPEDRLTDRDPWSAESYKNKAVRPLVSRKDVEMVDIVRALDEAATQLTVEEQDLLDDMLEASRDDGDDDDDDILDDVSADASDGGRVKRSCGCSIRCRRSSCHCSSCGCKCKCTWWGKRAKCK